MEYDADREYGICEYCGTKLVQEKIVVEHRTDESGKYRNYLSLADRAFAAGNYKEARDYYTRALEINPDNNTAVFRKALCTGCIFSPGIRTNEVVAGVRSAYLSADNEEKKKMSEEIRNMISRIEVRCPSEFTSIKSCEEHVNSVLAFCELAYSLYEYTDRGNRMAVENYCSKTISVCDLVKSNYVCNVTNNNENLSFNFSFGLKGIDVSSNASQSGPKSYNTPKNILDRISYIRKFFVNENNKLISSDLESMKTAVDMAKEEVGKLPLNLKILHTVFSIPMLIAAAVIALFIKPLPGVILLAAEIICYFVYLKIDADGKAQNAYANLRHRNEEYIKNKNQLRH